MLRKSIIAWSMTAGIVGIAAPEPSPIEVRGTLAERIATELIDATAEPRVNADGSRELELKQLTCTQTFNAACAAEDGVSGKMVKLAIGEARRFLDILKEAGVQPTQPGVFPIWRFVPFTCSLPAPGGGEASCVMTPHNGEAASVAAESF